MPDWALTEKDIESLADGCELLGSGGGGDSHSFRIVLKNLIAARGPIQVLDTESLAPESLAVNVGFVGAPVVMTEKLFCERTISLALEAMSRRLGRPIDAIMSAEIAGANGLSAFLAGAMLGLPVVDADGMGRAFPLNDMVTYSMYGRSGSPTIATTDHGEVVCIEGNSNRRLEQFSRAISAANGSMCFGADYPLSGDEVRACAVRGSVSLALRIGAALKSARSTRRNVCEELAAVLGGGDGSGVRSLIDGKVVDCRQEIRGGWQFGRVTIESIPPVHRMVLEFQNEFLIATRDGVTLATTPDIISIVDTDTLRNITSDGVRFGQRVIVISIKAPEILTTAAALSVVGPRAFGFDLDYRPINPSQ